MNLPNKPTLPEYQKHIHELIVKLGFDDETVPQIFMLFLEEAGQQAPAGDTLDKAQTKIHPGQMPFLQRLAEHLGTNLPQPPNKLLYFKRKCYTYPCCELLCNYLYSVCKR
jgi:hypothetical protein